VSEATLRTLHFKMAYFNPHYTDLQIQVRSTFIVMTLTLIVYYMYRTCKVPRHVVLNEDQKAVTWLGIGCVLFNDPTYLASVYKPGIFSSVVS
jgi:hypothetical protein